MSAVHVRVRLAEESYAVPVESVLEVSELGELAPVPGAHAAALGIRNLRGEVLPVFDLGSVLNATAGRAVRAFLLVAEQGGVRAGFAIDDVTSVGTLAPAVEEAESDLLTGAVLEDASLIGIIDVPRLFAELTLAAA